MIHTVPEYGGMVIGTGRPMTYQEAFDAAGRLSDNASKSQSLRDVLKGTQTAQDDFLVGTVATNVLTLERAEEIA